MERTLKIGFVGTGAFCQGIHIPNVSQNPGFEIVAFCDLQEDLLARLRERYQPRYVTTDAEKIFADPDIEAVICATKPAARMEIMKLAATHGKHLFVEKPLCYHEEQAEPMIRLIRDSGILFMVGFNRPYSPIMQATKPLYHGHRKGNTLIIYRIIGEAQLWPPGHKKAIIEEEESTIVHEATHIFDLLNWLTDMEPTRVFTAGGGNMDNIITLTYPRDTYAVVISGDNSCSAYPKERLEIDTNHGTIVADNFRDLTAVGVQDQLIQRRFHDVGEQEDDVSPAERVRRMWKWHQSITPEQKAYGYYYDTKSRKRGMKGHYEEMEHFRRSVLAGRPPETGVFRGAMAELIAWRAVDSWQTGQPVDLDFSHLKA